MKIRFSIIGKDLLSASVKTDRHGTVTGSGKTVDEAYKNLLNNLKLLDIEDIGSYKHLNY